MSWVNLNQSLDKKEIIWRDLALDDSVLVKTAGYSQVILEIEKIGSCLVTVHANHRTGKMILPVINMYSGFSTNYIGERGSYVIDAKGYDEILIEASFGRKTDGSANGQVLSARIHKTNNIIQPKEIREKPKNKIPQPDLLSMTSSYELARAIKDGVLYGSRDNIIRKSENWGETWESVESLPSGTKVRHMCITDSGRIVVVTGEGPVYTSDENGVNFVETLNLGIDATNALFGFDFYKDMVFVATYNTDKSRPSPATKAYVSEDGGITWRVCFDSQELGAPLGNHHLHDIRYDPYEDLIWVSLGDTPKYAMVYYSADRGETWYQVADYGNAPLQSTIIIPLPECVLFVSDASVTGVTRYNRPETGTPVGSYLNFEIAYIAETHRTDTRGEVPIAATPHIDYKRGVAYFGWAILPAAENGGERLKRAQVFATDGYRFYNIWRSNEKMIGIGYNRAFGDDENVMVVIHDENLGDYPRSLLRFNADMWKER